MGWLVASILFVTAVFLYITAFAYYHTARGLAEYIEAHFGTAMTEHDLRSIRQEAIARYFARRKQG